MIFGAIVAGLEIIRDVAVDQGVDLSKYRMILYALSLILILYIAYAWIAGRIIPGWTSLMLVVVILGAVQMFVLALMGEYIGRLYNEAKGRPLYIVQEVAGDAARHARLGHLAHAEEQLPSGYEKPARLTSN